jgi:hypothetical protein
MSVFLSCIARSAMNFSGQRVSYPVRPVTGAPADLTILSRRLCPARPRRSGGRRSPNSLSPPTLVGRIATENLAFPDLSRPAEAPPTPGRNHRNGGRHHFGTWTRSSRNRRAALSRNDDDFRRNRRFGVDYRGDCVGAIACLDAITRTNEEIRRPTAREDAGSR